MGNLLWQILNNNGITLSLRIKGKNNAWTAPNDLARLIDVTSDIDESHTSLGESLIPQSKKRKSSAKEDEQTAKAELWKALTTQLSQGSSLNSHTESKLTAKQGATQQEDRAYVFGRTVADSLLQCDTKDWPRLKKKIMDIFFEYEEKKLTSNRFNQTTTPYNN